MLKKSTSSASSSQIITAAGVSIMMPCSGIAYGICSRLSSAATSATISRIRSTSSTEMIIGYMMARFPYFAARSSARSCVLNTSGCFRQIRIARYPIAGLSSFPSPR